MAIVVEGVAEAEADGQEGQEDSRQLHCARDEENPEVLSCCLDGT